jgi:hypothetical protein
VIEAQATRSSSLDLAFSATTLALVLAFLARSFFYWQHVIEIAMEDAVGAP